MYLDKEILEMASHSCSLSYSKLKEAYPSETRRYKYIFTFDLSYYLDYLESLLRIEPGNLDETLFTDSDTIYLTYNIMNIVAHYRHFVATKFGLSNVIVIYCSEVSMYNRFEKLFEVLSNFLIMFKKTIFIDKITEGFNNPYVQSHAVIYTVQKIIAMNLAIKKECIICTLGSSIIDYQLLNLVKHSYHIKHGEVIPKHKMWYTDDFFGSKVHFTELEISKMIQLTSSIIALLGGKKGPKGRVKDYVGKHKTSIVKKIRQFLIDSSSYFDEELEEYFYNYMIKTGDEVNDSMFQVRRKQVDYKKNPDVGLLVSKLMKSWESKFHSKMVYSFNDIYELPDLRLKVEWLSEI